MVQAFLANNLPQNTKNYSVSPYVEAMFQAFLPNKKLQNTVNYSVFYPCFNTGFSLLATQLAPKHCKLQCFLPML